MEYVDHPFKSPVIISLCTGMRGLERGFERAIGPITVAAYVEIEAFIIFNLVRQMEQGMVGAAPVWSDLKTFPAAAFHGKVHGIIGGYPCQPFSTAGLQKGESDPRHLWPYIRKSIYTIKPLWCFFENVANHLNLGFEGVYNELSAMGYSVEAGLYSASEVGAPHQRKRLFILAILGNAKGHYQRHDRKLARESKRKAGGSNNELADTNGEVKNNGSQGIDQWKEHISYLGDGVWHRVEPGSSTLANAGSPGHEGDKRPSPPDEGIYQQESLGSIAKRCADEFPAGQGDFQYPWEEPRTVEPGVGCTVNGYSFKDDLLRMYGNGVVEQTAALAFDELLRKHFSAQ